MKKSKQMIIKALMNHREDGLTIQNLIDITKLARGTIKISLLYLIIDGKVREIEYTKNSKVYKIR